MNLGEQIRQIRINKGMTMEEFGKVLKTSKVTVNNWEKGRNLPNKERLLKIAEMTGVTVSEFLDEPQLYLSLTEEEKFILDHYRNGAKIEMTIGILSDYSKEEANKIMSFFPDNKQVITERCSWLTNTKNPLEKLKVITHYKEKSHSAAKQ